MKLLRSIFLFVALSFASNSHAVLIVDTFEGFSLGDTINALTGVTITAANGGTPTVATATTPVVLGQPMGLYNSTLANPFESALLFDFTGVGSSIGALVDFGVIGPGLQLTAYDGLAGTGSVLATAATSIDGSFLGVSAVGIKSAVFSKVTNVAFNTTWLLDNLTYEFDNNVIPNPVPVPATLLLIVLGLASLGFEKRRRRTN